MNNLIYLLRIGFQKRPVEVIFPITFSCNSRCKMCSRWQIDTTKEELNIEEIKRTFKQLKDFGVLIVNVTGGEPLLRKDIFEVLDILRDLGLKVVFTSNGILLKEKIIKRLIAYENLELIISLDTLDKKIYKEFRGVDAFDVVIKNIKLVKKIDPNYPLRIHAVFSKLNIGEFDRLVEFAKENKLRFSAMPYNYEMQYENKEDSLMYNAEELIPVFKRLSKMTSLPHISGFGVIYEKAIDWMRGKDIGRCNAGREIIYVHHDGKVSICGEFPKVIDLRKQDIRKSWNQKKFIAPAKGCRKCFVGCYWGFAILKQNKTKVIKELLTSKKIINLLTKSQF